MKAEKRDPSDPVVKVAIFLLYLERHSLSSTKSIFKELGETKTRELTQVMADLGPIEFETIQDIIEEMFNLCIAQKTVLGGKNMSAQILKDSFGINQHQARAKNNPYLFESVQDDIIYNFLEKESNQLAAFVFFHLNPDKLQRIIQKYPTEKAKEIIALTLNIKLDKNETTQAFIHKLEEKCHNHEQDSLSNRDDLQIKKFSQVFENLEGKQSELILKELEKTNLNAAEKIKKAMYSLEDFESLSDVDMKTLLIEFKQSKQLAVIVHIASTPLQTVILKNATERVRAIIEEEIETLPTPLPSDTIKEATSHFFNIAKQLEKKKKISKIKP